MCQTATYATSVRLETRKSVGSMSVYHYFSDRSSDDVVYPLHPLPFVVSVDLPHYGKSKCTCCTAQMTPRIKEIPMIAMVFPKNELSDFLSNINMHHTILSSFHEKSTSKDNINKVFTSYY